MGSYTIFFFCGRALFISSHAMGKKKTSVLQQTIEQDGHGKGERVLLRQTTQ